MQFHGRFWNPSRPDQAYAGRVKTKDGEPALWVTSPADDVEVTHVFNREPVIFGRSTTGRNVTLWHTYAEDNYLIEQATDDHDHFLWKQTYAYVIEGAHLPDPGAPLFRQSTATYKHLFYWAIHPREIAHDQATPPAFETAVLKNVYGLGIDAHVQIEDPPVVEDFASGGRRFHRFNGEDVRVSFTFDTPQLLSTHQRLAFNLRDLLTFSYGRSATPLRQTLSVDPDSADLTYSYRQDIKKHEPQLHGSRMALRPGQLSPELMFPRWWDATTELYPLTQILAGRHYTKRAYIEGHVLAAVAATERLYTQLKMPSTRFSKAFFDVRKRDIQSADADRDARHEEQADFTKFLSEVLKNQPTFDTKLRGIAAYANLDQIKAADIDVDLWVQKTKKVRNKLAHQGSHVDSLTRDDDQDWLGRVDDSTRVILALALRRWLGAEPLPLPQVRRVFRGRGTQHEPEPQPGTAREGNPGGE